jgi:hypothetical protein
MNTEDSLVMQGVKIEMASLVFEIQKLRAEIERKEHLKDIPEWLTLEMAAGLKGGAALDTYKTKLFLQ